MKWRKYEIEILSGFNKEVTEEYLRNFCKENYSSYSIKELSDSEDGKMVWRKYEVEMFSSNDKVEFERDLKDFLILTYRTFRIEELTEGKDTIWRCTDQEFCCWQSDMEHSKCPNCGGVLEEI